MIEHPAYKGLGETDLSEYRATGRWYRHSKSGAQVFHVHNDDPENLFSFVFKTLPTDSTGVAHILEHTVLCGSEKYPVKDPFIQLVRGSLNTFVNAMTYPDKTVYPASSTVHQDLFNLMSVYGDAVFFPLLKEEFFRQEGHRLQFNHDDALEITGIVYNEMKGNYSNHDSLVGEWSARSLSPDTPYGHDSGGDPAEIPDLTYQQFVDFHKTNYHPANCLIFLYGDIETQEYLTFLDERFLSRFDMGKAVGEIPRQPRWTEPKDLLVPSPADGEDATTSVSVNWLLEPVTDPFRMLSLELMSYVLLGSSAAPLQKALIDSGLGGDLSASTGLHSDMFEMVFSAGLRDTDVTRKAEIEAVVTRALQEVVRDGFDPDLVEGSLRKVEFRQREIKGGGPNGLRLMGRSLKGWLHGLAPDETLRFDAPFAELRKRIENGRYLESLIEETILSNYHRTTVVVAPDVELRQREAASLASRLSTIQKALTPQDRESLKEKQTALQAMQQTPDSPEAIATLPFLSVSDLPESLESIPTRETSLSGGTPLLVHDLFTNGVVYLDLCFDVTSLPNELLPYMPLFAMSIDEVGLPGRDYDAVATELSLKCGGFVGFTEAEVPVGGGEPSRRLSFRLKCLESTVSEAVDLVAEILTSATFGNTDRVADLVKEARSDMTASVLPGGHGLATLRAGRQFTPSDQYEDLWRGVGQLLFITAERSATEYCAAFQQINELMVNSSRLLVNITATDTAVEEALPHIERLVAALPKGASADSTSLGDLEAPGAEALVTSSDVAFVAAAMPASQYGTEGYMHEQILAHILRTGPLWESIRMQGGAYGAGASVRGLDGVFSFFSYRDPRIAETVQAFADSLKQIAADGVSDPELELALIGVTGQLIRPRSPGQKGSDALRRYLNGIKDEMRHRNYQTLLSTTAASIQSAADRLSQSMAQSSLAVVAGSDMVDSASGSIPALGEHRLQLPT